MDAGKSSEPVIPDLPWADAQLLLDPRGVSMECVSEAKTKTKQTLTKSKTLPCSKKNVSLLKSFQKMLKTGPQRVPPCRSLRLQLKIGISTCNNKQPFWL